MKRSGIVVPLNSLVRRNVPINSMIDAAVKCTKCGAGYGKCDCWTECRCGWHYERGGQCRNQVHKTGVFTSESEPNTPLHSPTVAKRKEVE